MTMSVLLQTFPGGRTLRALPGQVVGRGLFAAVPVQHPRVSEAHAVLSLRDGLFLLAARGSLFLQGSERSRIELRADQDISLLEDGSARLVVLRVDRSVEDLALVVDDGTPHQMPPIEEGYALVAGTPPALVRAGGHAARFWIAEGYWYVLPDGEEAQPFEVGTEWQVNGHTVELVDLGAVAGTETEGNGLGTPLQAAGERTRLVVRVDTAGPRVDALGQDGEAMSVLGGQPGAILAALLEHPDPLPWTEIAAPLWPTQATKNARLLQNNFDTNLRYAKQWLGGLQPPSGVELARESKRVWIRGLPRRTI